MVHIPIETAPYLEAAIYLPMRMILLEKGYAQIEAGQFKLKRPYFHLIETARKVLKKIESEGVFKKHHLKVVRGRSDKLFTEYFLHYHQTIVEYTPSQSCGGNG